MGSDKQGEQACVWRKLKAASGHELGCEALGSASGWLQAQPLGTASQGECVLGVIQKDFVPREFFLEVSQKLPLEGRPQWQRAWLPPPRPSKPAHWIQIHSGREYL